MTEMTNQLFGRYGCRCSTLLDVGRWMLDVGCWMLDVWKLAEESRIQTCDTSLSNDH